MGLTGFNRQRRVQLVEKVGEEAAQKLISKGIDSVEKLSRLDEVCDVLGISEADRKEIKKAAGIKDIKPESKPQTEDYPTHKGGGYYILSNGDQVQGKEAAIEAQAELNEEQ